MLELILGRAGTEKMESLVRGACEAGKKRAQVFLVPEQMSHETERLLCREGGPSVSLSTEVLSFTRLSDRVLAQGGGLAEPVLDAGGRLLLMHNAIRGVADKLTVYAKPSRKPAFFLSLLGTVDELKRSCITPEDLLAAAAEMGERGDKLRDLALICGAYDALTAQVSLDPRDKLTRVAETLKTCRWAAGKDFSVAGFLDFSPQEERILRELLRQGHSVSVALQCENWEGPEEDGGIFLPARRTARTLLEMAAECHCSAQVRVLKEQRADRVSALRELEQRLFAEFPRSEMPCGGAVRIFRARTARSELEWAASEIRTLAASGEYRFRDIAVAARSMEGYEALLASVFDSYEIPVYLARKEDILQKPVLTLVTAALDCAAGGYAYDDMFRYLKTGLTPIAREDCDLLENYVLKWDISGRKWAEKESWAMHPRGYDLDWRDEDRALLERVDRARRQAVEPLEALRGNKERTGRGQAKALYTFLESIGAREKLTARSERLRQAGELTLAEEDRQLWDILCGALEQCAAVLGDAPMELDEFSALFQLVLSQYSVGAIPVALDRVTAGDMTRIANRRCRVLFLLGADDTQLPQVSPAPGVLTDEERLALTELGLRPALRMEEKLQREMTAAYDVCTQPSERLYLSWAQFGPSGEERRPSFLVRRVQAVFPDLRPEQEEDSDGLFRLTAPRAALARAGSDRAVRQALRALPEYSSEAEKLDGAEHWTRGELRPGTARALYGQKMSMSASRMDRFNSCHFSYFMQFGLRAEPRQPAGFHAPEYGTYVHYILEHVLRRAGEKGGVKQVDDDALRAMTAEASARYVSERLRGMAGESARFRYLFLRLEDTVWRIVKNAAEELRASDFSPLSFELAIGGQEAEVPPIERTQNGVTIRLTGKVDRVDGWVHDGRLYLRVVDYKTGRKSFDLTEVYAGMGMQMLLYLFALKEEGKTLYGKEIVPAGVLYLPAREEILAGSGRMEEDERRRELDKKLRRKGLLLGDGEVLSAMEREENGALRFLPVKVSARSGDLAGSLVSAEQFGALEKHTEHVLRQICRELGRSNISADPFWRGEDRNACRYCDYAEACHFEPGRGGDCRRFLSTVGGEDFWQVIRREADEEGESDGN